MAEDKLNRKEIARLRRLGEKIKISLSPFADFSGIGIPSRTNRFAMLDDMKEYLEIHGYQINRKKK
jgi:hypothetical protein